MNKFIYLILIFFSHSFYGQDPYAIKYTINDGLPTNTIYSTFQDKDGFIWFASDVGAIKYDSKNFTLYNLDNGLTDNEVFIIREDFKGRKWFLTLNGVPSFIKDGQVFNDKNSTLIQQIKSKSMFVDFYLDEHKNIYLISRKGEINKIDNNDKVTQISNKNAITSGIWRKDERIYIMNNLGVYDPILKKIVKKHKNNFYSRVYHIKNETYYSKLNKLYQVLPNEKVNLIAELPEAMDIINIYKESDTKIWICTRKGLFLFKNNQLKKHYFKTNVVTSISKDIEGNYWVTTLNNGILLIPFFTIFKKNILINTISKKDKNEIWLGGFKNDFYIKKKNSFIKKKLNENYRKDVISNIRFINNEVYVLGKSGIQKRTLQNKVDIPFSINDLIQKDKDLFIATTFTSKTSGKTLLNHNYNLIRNKRILDKRTKVLEKDNNSIFIGTNTGLYAYNKNSKLTFLGDSISALKSSINDLFYDADNKILLVGTSSKGLLLLEHKKLKFIVSKKNGLNNNTVNSIKKFEKNQYLIGTNDGVNLLNIKDSTINVKNYNAALVFKNEKINALSVANDTVYMATNNGLLYFHKEYLTQKKDKPVIYIDNIYANNYKVKKENQSKIDYKTNDIKIDFTGISFLDQGKLDFYYQLNNKGWIKTNESQVNFQSLPSKSYIFSLYSINGNNLKSEVKTISFTIIKPFWEKWWFLLSAFLILCFLIYFAINRRLNYIEKNFLKEKKSILLENQNIILENQMLALEQKALRLQMNPHFIFNALNTIKGYYAEGNVKEASNYISNFSKLLRLLLENVEQYIPLSLEVEMLDLYLKLTTVRYQNKFEYKIVIDKTLNAREINIPTLLMQPIIENAVIHGVSPKNTKGKIEVTFLKKEEFLICKVLDDGIGRKASQKNKNHLHNSRALKIIKERLELIEIQENINCDFQIRDLMNNGKSTGTEVKITIPLLKIW